ncbi:MAG: type II toxin-antitoxin system VapC family toxin [Planctomycetes bacterium]|uniref:type II toxin-antitoxin system VapC family toxin n=1 Tax=Candidatus Wunengus sp. YC65 TaxID=3367701 RepID=UPI001D20134C|nr:type II toxin-antitoxin system VapC family toxin [Planctomycetota bacterium]
MKYLLDTNTCIYFLNGNESLKKKFREIGVYSLSISNCVLAELYFGAYRSKKVEENVKHIELFKKNLTILSDSEESARLFGKIKAELRSKGTIIEDFDILIASIAISNNHILITNNTEHFERIEGLKIQNWVNM